MASDTHKGTGIPLYYRIPLLYVEPPLALGGAVLLHFAPADFFTSISPNEVPSHDALASVRVLTDMLAAMHVAFAFILAVVMLRCGASGSGHSGDPDRPDRLDRDRDLGAWRLVCAGLLLSDGLHIAAGVREYGWVASFSPSTWRASDWVNWGVLWGMGTVRLAAVLGIGLGDGQGARSKGGSVAPPVKG